MKDCSEGANSFEIDKKSMIIYAGVNFDVVGNMNHRTALWEWKEAALRANGFDPVKVREHISSRS